MWRRLLIVLSFLNVLGCVGGWVYLVLAGAPGMPVAEMMRPGTFDSFVIPGWILLVVVGGTQLLAGIVLLRRRASAPFWSAVAGFAMLIWIYVEVVLMTGTAPLHHIYFAVGLVQVGCTLALLGVFDARRRGSVIGFPTGATASSEVNEPGDTTSRTTSELP